MFNLVSMNAIRTDFDAAMEKQGYLRATVMYKNWGITAKKFAALVKKGYDCDSFIVNGVRYIHKDAPNPLDGPMEV